MTNSNVSGENSNKEIDLSGFITRRNFLRTSLFGATALALVACGATASPVNTPVVTTSGAATTAATSAGSAKPGGMVTTAFFNDPPNFDIHNGINISRYYFQALTYNGLMRPKSGTGVDPIALEVEPDLAESYEQTSPTVYTFKLRKNVKWHDGQDFTSADVKYSIERILENKPERARRFMFEAVDKIDTPDANTVVFTLKYPFSPFLVYLASIDAMIAPKHIPGEELATKVVGTGPFMYDSAASIKANKYVLKKNPNYFIAGRPYLDGVTLLVQPDVTTQEAGLRSGQIDLQYTPYTKATLGNLDQTKTLQLQRHMSLPSNQIQINIARKPFDDVRVRRALTMALDRQAMIEVVWGGEGQLDGPVPSAMKEWAIEDPLNNLPWLKRDVEGAKKLLAEAGYPNGFSTTMNFGTPYPEQVKLAQLANAQWKDIGVTAELKGVDGPTWNQLQAQKNFDLMCVTFVTYEDVDFYTYGFYYPGAGRNIGSWDDKEISDLLIKQRQATDKAERKKILLDVQKKIADQAWVIYGATGYAYGVAQNYVKGYQANPFIHTRQFDKIWLAK